MLPSLEKWLEIWRHAAEPLISGRFLPARSAGGRYTAAPVVQFEPNFALLAIVRRLSGSAQVLLVSIAAVRSR